MYKKNIKISIVSILVLFVALLSCVCSSFISNSKNVYALSSSYTIDDGTNLKMTTGASIRTVSQEGSGLRFLVEYKKSYVDDLTNSGQYSEISFGAFIVPNSYRSNFPITHQGLAGKTVLEIPITSFLSDTSNGYYKAYATMTDIRPNNYDRQFLSRHYVKLVRTNGNVEYIYAPLATEPRSVYQVAKMAYGDRNSATSSNYQYDTSKSGNYKYSPYSSSQLAIIKTYIDGVVILDKNTLAYAGELDADLYTPAYSVVNNTISSSSKIVKMYWGDGTKIDATSTSSNSATFSLQSTSRSAGTVNSYSFNIIGGNDVMPIVGYGGMFENNKAEQNLYGADWNSVNYVDSYTKQAGYWMPKYKALGINTMAYIGQTMQQTYSPIQLKAAQDNNIAVFLENRDLRSNLKDGTAISDWKTTVYGLVDHFQLTRYSSFVGVYTRDEPKNSTDISRMKTAQDNINANCSSSMANRTFYSNLLPYNPGDDFGYDSYSAYIDAYVSNLNPKFLSYDMYPFRVYSDSTPNKIDISGYFSNLSTIRSKANLYGIPFWSFIQCGTDWSDNGEGVNKPANTHLNRPTEGEFRWLVNTTLAYGAKGIEYFELQQFSVNAISSGGANNYSRSGVWGYNGQQNEWYPYVLEANNQIKAIDEYLMNATQEGIIVSGSGYGSSYVVNGDKRNSYWELIGVTGNVMVGCFNYKGKTALYVVSDATDGSSGSATLTFDNNYTYTQVKSATKTKNVIKNKTISLSGLRAGEGVLIVLD